MSLDDPKAHAVTSAIFSGSAIVAAAAATDGVIAGARRPVDDDVEPLFDWALSAVGTLDDEAERDHVFTAFAFTVSSKSRRRSLSHDEHNSKSPSPITTDESLRCFGQGPLGNPSQTGMATYIR